MLRWGVRLGHIVAHYKPTSFVEIGCGLAIPSLTLTKKGITSGEAFDLVPKHLRHGKEHASFLRS